MAARSKRKKKHLDFEKLNKLKEAVLAVVIVVFCIAGFHRDATTVVRYGEVEKIKYSYHFPDVGQGDCTIIVSGDYCVVIDTASMSEGAVVAEYVKSVADDVDCLILTHPHEDHIGGTEDLINRIDVGCVIVPDIEATTTLYDDYLNQISEKNIELRYAEAGGVYSVGDIRLEILGPLYEDIEEVNNSGIVVKAVTEDISVLVTGDIEEEAEAALLYEYGDAVLAADILKVPHHGADASSTVEFLDAVSPTYAVIGSELYNTFGHPAAQTLDRLEERGIKYYITFEHGHVVFVSDGKNLAPTQ